MKVPADTQASYSSRSASVSVPAVDLPARSCMRLLASADARSWTTFLATSGVMQSPSGSSRSVSAECTVAMAESFVAWPVPGVDPKVYRRSCIMSTAAIAWILPPTHSEWAIATDEGHVGSSPHVGIAAEDEAGLGGKDLPKALGLDMVGQQRRDSERDGSVP
jgi:hypothetical protein